MVAIPESVYSRLDMIRALVAHFQLSGNHAVANVRLDDLQFDVLALDHSRNALVGIECIHGGQPRTLTEQFVKANSHLEAAKCGALNFRMLADKVKNKEGLPKLNAHKPSCLQFSVSVALMDRVCKRVDLLRVLKTQFPAIGIVRVKMNGQCRDYIRDRSGKKDSALTSSNAVKISV